VNRGRRRPLLALAWTAAVLLPGCADRRPGPERIVLIVIDTLRRDHVSLYGGNHRTPHIDHLAEGGLVVRDLSASFHQTSMSMGALFTGRTPSLESGDRSRPLAWTGRTWCGLTRFASPDDGSSCIPDALRTLPERLQEAGYWTIGVTSNQLLFAPAGFERGFDHYTEVGEKGPRAWRTRTWPRVQEAVAAALARRSRDRFFLYVHYMDAHDYRLRGVPYARGVQSADEGVGALLDHLREQDLLDAATVVLTSDHGEMLGEQYPPGRSRRRWNHLGNPSYQPVLEVPLVVVPPPAFALPSPIRTQDLHDLVLRLAGLEVSPQRDLEPDELLLTERKYLTYRRGRFKASFPRVKGWPVLFDLEADPREQRNAARQHPDVMKRYRRRADALAASLAARAAFTGKLTPEDRSRLEALGYLGEEPSR
jgi:arylsulfatase A-like enzyme